jgi:hypothetical protein
VVEEESGDGEGDKEDDVDVDLVILVEDGDDAGVILDIDGWVEEEASRVGKSVDKVPTVMVERMEFVFPVDEPEWTRDKGSGLVDVADARGDWKEPVMLSMLVMSKNGKELAAGRLLQRT